LGYIRQAQLTEQALEVYERLLRENDRDPAELVISGQWAFYTDRVSEAENASADTVVIFPPERDTAEGGKAHGETSEILEKPLSRDEQVRYLKA
jgi:septum formation protein